MKNDINVAIIGFGLSGSVFHAPVITSVPGFNLSKIYTTSAENIALAVKNYPEAIIVQNTDEIMTDASIDLVVIASPNTSHFLLAESAMLSGKHVVIDKPFTVTSEEADRLIETAKRCKRVLSVFQNRRWDSDFRTVKKIIESRMLGNLAECEIHFDRFRNEIKKNAWREECAPGSGILYDLGSHLIDQAQTLFGMPDEIWADVRIQRPEGKAADSFEIILNYGRIKVSLKAGMLVRAHLPRYILLGDQGSFIKYGLDVQEADLNAGYTPLTKKEWGREPEALYGSIDTAINGVNVKGKVESERGDYREYYRSISKAILFGEELAVKPEQARNTIRLIELAMESSESKKTVKIEYKNGLIV